jgi:pimeloyl-ACP methyl ester carboxylesterase
MSAYVSFDVESHTLAALSLNAGTTGEPVILVHGITSSIAVWQVNPLPYILALGPCYSLSLPGHYPAAFPPAFQEEQLTAEMLARVMAKAICQLVGKRPVTLIGHSTGGFAVLNIAAHYPNIARRVISVAGFAHGRWIGFLGFYQRLVRTGRAGKALFKAIYRLTRASPGLFRTALRAYAANATALYANPDLEEVIELNLFNYQHMDLDTMAQYFSVMPEIDITSLLPQIQAPTLAVAGEYDATVPPEESRKIASIVPDAELVLIPGGRHTLFWERPREYREVLSAWLGKTVS